MEWSVMDWNPAPDTVATNTIPPEMVAAVQPECMTPVEMILRAYDESLVDLGD